MMIVMVTMMVNICDDDCYLVRKVILVKEMMSCNVSPVAMFLTHPKGTEPFIYAFHFECEMISFRESVSETFSNPPPNAETYFAPNTFREFHK